MTYLLQPPPDEYDDWTILVTDDAGLVARHSSYPTEARARETLEALKWRESLCDGHMRLAQQGLVIDTNTGKPWVEPKGRKAPALKIEPTKRKKP